MKATRTTQPYRKGPRQPGMALAAMLKGRAAGARNPMDTRRKAQKRGRAGRKGSLAAALARAQQSM